MKYVIIIPDGAADGPLNELDGLTPFEAASKPFTDALAREGRVGTVATTPEGMGCGSDICCMSLLGYDPVLYHTGRAPLEAAALGIELDPADWVFRLNIVTVIEQMMQDHSAGHITSDEGRRLLEDFAATIDVPDLLLYPGVSYRNIMVDVSGRADATGAARDWSKLETTPPHDIPGEPIQRHLPRGPVHAKVLVDMIERSGALFEDHEINHTRRELGEMPATHIWPWGEGRRPSMEHFEQRFGLKGAMITAVDLLAGISQFIGWDRLDVPGQTSYHDNDYAAAGQHAIAALHDYDVVCVHVEAPDEAAHAADASTKVAAIEAIDAHIVGPVHAALEAGFQDQWRVLYLPDHYTRCDTRKHDPHPVPFMIAGRNMRGLVPRKFTESDAEQSDLHVAYGHELMEYFLFGALK